MAAPPRAPDVHLERRVEAAAVAAEAAGRRGRRPDLVVADLAARVRAGAPPGGDAEARERAMEQIRLLSV